MSRYLDFDVLRRANALRLPLFKNALGEPAHAYRDGSDWSIAEWLNAVAGEAGEACNLAKKMRRGDFGPADSVEYLRAAQALAHELADVVIYADIAAAQVYVSLGNAVAQKFNIVSRRVAADVYIGRVTLTGSVVVYQEREQSTLGMPVEIL